MVLEGDDYEGGIQTNRQTDIRTGRNDEERQADIKKARRQASNR